MPRSLTPLTHLLPPRPFHPAVQTTLIPRPQLNARPFHIPFTLLPLSSTSTTAPTNVPCTSRSPHLSLSHSSPSPSSYLSTSTPTSNTQTTNNLSTYHLTRPSILSPLFSSQPTRFGQSSLPFLALGSSSPNQPLQIRFPTYGSEYQPSNRKRKNKHGFLKRLRDRIHVKMLWRRKLKGRKFLSH